MSQRWIHAHRRNGFIHLGARSAHRSRTLHTAEMGSYTWGHDPHAVAARCTPQESAHTLGCVCSLQRAATACRVRPQGQWFESLFVSAICSVQRAECNPKVSGSNLCFIFVRRAVCSVQLQRAECDPKFSAIRHANERAKYALQARPARCTHERTTLRTHSSYAAQVCITNSACCIIP